MRVRSRDRRDELAIILDFIQAVDQVVCVRLDRLGRSIRDVLNIVHELDKKGASLRVLEPEIETSGAVGKVVLTALGMVSEMELEFLRGCQRVGIEAAKKKGVYKGRPVSLNHSKIAALKAARRGATEIGCSRAAIYKILSAASRAKAA